MTIEWKCSFSAINAINLVVLILFTSLLWKPLSAAKYEPNWKSLDTRPLPNWYDQAKVGIFIHWGVYSVPSFGSEWFWINWNKKNPDYVNYMNKNYKPGFTYQEFGRDFTAEHFNAHEWTELFKQSGARYVVLTSKHHDGFTMWPSKYSFSWNSVDVGPHRDVVGELSMAIAANSSLKFGLYHSLYEWFNPMYMGDKMKLYMTDEFVDKKIWPEMMELVNRYHPQVLWSDGDWEAPDKYWKSTDFIAWLYNDSPVRDTIVTNDRWGIGVTCKHGDFYTCSDRYNPGILQPHKWENAMTLDKKSWGHRSNARLEDYMTSDDLIRELVSTVSCGGNLLINVGPTKEGLIEPIFAERLKDMGSWLKINGEAIYNTIPWTFQNDTKTPNVWYTNAPIKNSKRSTVYAIVLDYPYDAGGVNLFSLGRLYDNDTKVIMLGTNKPLKWYGSAEALYVTFPKKREIDKLGLKFAWTLKFDMPIKNLKDNRIPEILDMSNN